MSKQTIRYYRHDNINPNWMEMWAEFLENEQSPDEILDEICENACGIKLGASDATQRYAEHISAHLQAAFTAGVAYGQQHKSYEFESTKHFWKNYSKTIKNKKKEKLKCQTEN